MKHKVNYFRYENNLLSIYMNNFEDQLTGGHPNSLGNTIKIVEDVLKENVLFDELFNCYFSQNEVVRLRTSNAMKRICKEKKQLIIPYIDRFLNKIAKINQASTQWTLAHLFGLLINDMTNVQVKQAIKIMMNNIKYHNDWIVLNTTMQTLGEWAKKDLKLKKLLLPNLIRLSQDSRKSVSKQAIKTMKQLEG